MSTDYSIQPPFETSSSYKTLRVGHIDGDGDIEIEVEENFRGGDSTSFYLYKEDIVRLHEHLTKQIERLKENGQIG